MRVNASRPLTNQPIAEAKWLSRIIPLRSLEKRRVKLE